MHAARTGMCTAALLLKVPRTDTRGRLLAAFDDIEAELSGPCRIERETLRSDSKSLAEGEPHWERARALDTMLGEAWARAYGDRARIGAEAQLASYHDDVQLYELLGPEARLVATRTRLQATPVQSAVRAAHQAVADLPRRASRAPRYAQGAMRSRAHHCDQRASSVGLATSETAASSAISPVMRRAAHSRCGASRAAA